MWDTISSKIADIIGGLIYAIFNSLIEPFADIFTLQELIFGDIGENGDVILWGTFTETELALGFLPLYNVLLTISLFFFVIFIIIAGMRISSSGMNATRRNEIFEFTKELILVAIGLFYLPEIYSLVFDINSAFVGVFKGITGEDIFNVENTISESESLSGETGLIGKIIIELVLFGLGIWANFYYIIRKLTLILLMGLGPIMIVFWMFPSWKGITLAWMKELTGTIFIQSIHSFIFWAVAVLSLSQDKLIPTVILYVIFIPLGEQIRGLFGMGGNMTNGLSKAGAMFGMASIAGMAGAVKGALDGKSVTGALQSVKNGGKNIANDIKNGKGVGAALKDTAGRMAESAYASVKNGNALKAGEIVSKGGRAVFGAAGAIAGSGLGPVGAIALAEIGSAGGGAIGGLTGRTGALGAMGISKRLKQGKAGLEKLKDAQQNGDENIANAIANQQAASWAGENKDAIMGRLREDFPTATQQELDSKYAGIVANKASTYKASAQKTWGQAKDLASKQGNGEQLVSASANAMTEQWDRDNRKSFNEDWNKSNPQMPGESDNAYAQRRSVAFGQKKANMKDNFKKDGATFLRDKADVNGNVDREALGAYMSTAAQHHSGAGDVSNLGTAANQAMNHVSGVQMFSGAGKPNVNAIANNLAAARTEQQKTEFMQQAQNKGLSHEQASTQWRQQEAQVMKANVDNFASDEFVQNITGNYVPTASKWMGRLGQNSTAIINGAIGSDIQNVQNGFKVLNNAASQGMQTFKANMAEGNVFSAIPETLKGMNTGAINQIVANHGGDAAKAQANFVQNAGTVGALFLGRSGMEKVQGLAISATNKSGLGSHVQNQIYSPSEVMQMAQTVVDSNGVSQIAPGAIQQVTTRDGSFVQVRTASGERRTVSRIGAGSESLKQGETIYQDLTSQDGRTLEVASVGKSGVSTYQLDSGGGRIPVAHDVQNPISLLGNVNKPQHGHIPRQVAPVLNERVDGGNYAIEDLAKGIKNGTFTNPHVVVEKGQQYMTAQRDGLTFRVSPITNGDARLANNQTMTIPVEVTSGGEIRSKGGLQTGPSGQVIGVNGNLQTQEQAVVTQTTLQTINLANGQNGSRAVIERKVNVVQGMNEKQLGTTVHKVVQGATENVEGSQPTPVQVGQRQVFGEIPDGSMNFNHLMRSRTREHAQKNVDRRNGLDIVRRPQGVVGNY